MSNTYDDTNIFARILRGDVPCDKVLENDYALAFKDINPQAPVHILVIPKNHYTSMTDFSQQASPEEIAAFFRVVAKVVQDFDLENTGYRSIANAGVNGGQDVPHFHMHILGGTKLGPMLQKAA